MHDFYAARQRGTRGPGLDSGQLETIAAAAEVVGDIAAVRSDLDAYTDQADGEIATRGVAFGFTPVTVSAIPSPVGGYYVPAQGHKLFGFGVNCDVDFAPDQLQLVLNGLGGDYGAPARVATVRLRVVTRDLSAGDPSPEPNNFSLPTQLTGDEVLLDRSYTIAEIARQAGSAQSEIPVGFDLSSIPVIRKSKISFYIFNAYDASNLPISIGARNAISTAARTGANDWLFGFYSDGAVDLVGDAPILPENGVIAYRLTARSLIA